MTFSMIRFFLRRINQHINAIGWKRNLWITLLTMLLSTVTYASVDTYHFESAVQEAQYRTLITEFRCPTCQNQNLAGSDAPLAQDLKRTTYELVLAGKTDAEIRSYMVARYGDFISYKPPINAHTAWLWFLPPLFLLVLVSVWIGKHRSIADRTQSSVDRTAKEDQ